VNVYFKNKLLFILWLSFACIILAPSILYSIEIRPFNSQNLNPLVQIYGLPYIEDASVLSEGKKSVEFIFDVAQNFVEDSTSTEQLVFDGETYRFNIAASFGVNGSVECGFEIPYVFHDGGILDNFIEEYHDSFGFPQGGRDNAPRNRLLYLYTRNGKDRVKVDTSTSGLGDIRLKAALQLYKSEVNGSINGISLRTCLKLPTGESDTLHGSGSTDLSFWLSSSHGFKSSIGFIKLFGAAGILGMTDGKVIRAQQRNMVGFGGLGIGWCPLEWLLFKMQINGHTPFFKDSELKELNSNSAQLLMGGTLKISEHTELDIGVFEDIIVKTSPDVVFQFALRKIF